MKQLALKFSCLIMIQSLLACSGQERVDSLSASSALVEGKSLCGKIGWGTGNRQFSVVKDSRIHILSGSNELLNAFVSIVNNSENDEACFSSNSIEDPMAADWTGINSFAVMDERFPIESGANLSAQYPFLYCGSVHGSRGDCKVSLNTGSEFYCLESEDDRISGLLELFDSLDQFGACIISDAEAQEGNSLKTINVMGMSFAN